MLRRHARPGRRSGGGGLHHSRHPWTLPPGGRTCARLLGPGPLAREEVRAGPRTSSMPAELTPAVLRALEVARQRAHRLGAAEVAPIHLLHGLLAEEEGRSSLLLSRHGLPAGPQRDGLVGQP